MSRLNTYLTNFSQSAEVKKRLQGRVVKAAIVALLLPLFYAGTPLSNAAYTAPQASEDPMVDICWQDISTRNGAIIRKEGNDCVVEFRSNGAYDYRIPRGVTKVQLLVVAGGGSGGARAGAGGGGGGVVYKPEFVVTPNAVVSVIVGEGAGWTSAGGSVGGNSAFAGTNVAMGGGGGGTGNNINGSTRNGTTGGSGGGSMGHNGNIGATFYPGGASTQKTSGDATGLGNKGGTGSGPTNPVDQRQWMGGGGGGAGSAGSDSKFTTSGTLSWRAGDGGSGFLSDITGKPICYGAGGGGGAANDATSAGKGGACARTLGGVSETFTAGGDGTLGDLHAATGAQNTGSGGGGGGWNRTTEANGYGGAGGRGIVVIRYTVPQAILDLKAENTSGTTITDLSSSKNDATLNAGAKVIASSGTTPAYFNLDGSKSQYISTKTPYSGYHSVNFSIGIWFRTSTLNAGKIIGFESSQLGNASGAYDRHLYIGNDHKLYFGVFDGSGKVVRSKNMVNDGQWHYAFATLDDNGSSTANNTMSLSIDGVSQGTLAIGAVQNYTGFWRLGSYRIGGWPSITSDGFYTGDIGQATIYNWPVNQEFAASKYEELAAPVSVSAYSDTATGSIIAKWNKLAGVSTYTLKVYNAAGTTVVKSFPSEAGDSKVITSSEITAGNGYRISVTPNTSPTSGKYYFTESVKTPVVIAQAATCIPETSFSGPYTILQFKTVGKCAYVLPNVATPIEYFVVGGGGGGGTNAGFGGQGGFYRAGSVTASGATVSITVGDGGLGGADNSVFPGADLQAKGKVKSPLRNGGDGGNSALFLNNRSILASGGEGGLTEWDALACITSPDPAVLNKQNFPKLGSSVSGKYGLAGAPGGDAQGTGGYGGISGGAGVALKSLSYNSTTSFAGGGAGGSWSSISTSYGLGGSGGGGRGGYIASTTNSLANVGYPGTANTGGGGGAGGAYCAGGGKGGSGIVVLRHITKLVKAAPASVVLPETGTSNLHAHYVAANFNTLTKTWIDASGNGRNVKVTRGYPNLEINRVGVQNSKNDFITVSGTPSDAITLGALPSKYTLFHVARYSGANKGRIFQGTGGNWLSGFWAGYAGHAFHENWLSGNNGPGGTNNKTPQSDWIVSTDKRDSYRVQGKDRTGLNHAPQYTARTSIGINDGDNTDYSDWQVAEVIIYNRELSDTETAAVEEYLMTKYITSSGEVGGNVAGGGWFTPQMCLAGQVAVGITAYPDPAGFGHFQMRCKTIAASGTTLESAISYAANNGVTNQNIGSAGSWSPLNFKDCSADNVLVGLDFYKGARGDDFYVGGAKLKCAPLSNVKSITTGEFLGGVSSLASNAFPNGTINQNSGSYCPAGQIVNGFQGKSGGVTDALQVMCGYPPLPTPTGLTLTQGTSLKQLNATWTPVTNALTYSLSIYDSATGALLSTNNLTDLVGTSATINLATLPSISDDKGYRFAVTAIGDGIRYTYSLESGKSAGITTLPSTPAASWTSGNEPRINGLTSAVVVRGSKVTIYETVTPAVDVTYAYQWLKNGAVISNGTKYESATAENLVINNVAATDAGNYSVKVTSTRYGVSLETTSATVTLGVFGVNTPLSGIVKRSGTPFSMQVTSYGGGTVTYAFDPSYTSDTFTISSAGKITESVTAVSGDSFTAKVVATSSTYSLTDVSNEFTIKIVADQLTSPGDVSVTPTPGLRKSLKVTWNRAAETPTAIVRYQVLLQDSSTVGSNTFLVTNGLDSISETMTTINVDNYAGLLDNETYTVRVIAYDSTSLFADSESSTAGSGLTAAPLQDVFVTLSPTVKQSKTTSQSLTLTATAVNADRAVSSYQWLKNGIPLEGERAAILSIESLEVSDAGNYSVVLSAFFDGETITTESSFVEVSVVRSVEIDTPVDGLIAVKNEAYSLQLTTSAGTAPFVFEAATALPAGLTFDTSTGTISGTPTTIGFTRTQIRVKDVNNSVDTSTAFSISVVESRLDSTTVTVTPTPVTLKSFDLSWSAVTNADRYNIRIYDETGTALLATANGIIGTQYTFGSKDYLDMQDSTSYKFSVVAVASTGIYGDSTPSPKIASRTNLAPAAPVFSVNPADATALVGGSKTFTSTASASLGVLSYQWLKDDVEISGANSASYTIPIVSAASAGAYYVIATATLNGVSAAATSSKAELAIGLSVETPTVGLTATYGSAFKLPIQASGGNGTKNFQITGANALPNGLSLDAATGVISGTSSETVTAGVAISVTVTAGSETKVITFTLRVVEPQFIQVTGVTAEPTSGVRKSIDIKWSRTEASAEDMIYIITLYGQAGNSVLRTITTYETSTGTSYVLTERDYASIGDNATYQISVTSAGNNSTGNALESAKVIVTTIEGPEVPTITSQPSNSEVVIGSSLTLSVSANVANSGLLTYQWFKGSAAITGAIASTYAIPSIKTSDNGNYSVKITNVVNGGSLSITSNAAQVFATSVLAITTPVAGLNAPSDKPYRLMIESSGGSSPKTFTVSKGSLPGGLAIDSASGLIFGTPDSRTAGMNFTVAVTVRDSNASTATTEDFKIGVYIPQLDTPTVTATASSTALKTFDLDWAAVTNATSYSVFIYTTETGTVALNTTGLQNLTSQVPLTVTNRNVPSLDDGVKYWVSVVANFDSATAETQIATSPSSIRKAVTTCTVAACTNTGGGTGGGGTGGGGTGGGGITTPAAPTTPTIQTGPTLVIDPNQQFNSKVPVPGATSFAVSKGRLPAGLSLNASTGLISGLVTEFGPYNFTILATPPLPGTEVTYSGTIATPPPPPAPIVAPELNILPGAPFSYTPNVPGANNFQIKSGSLPAGVTLNPKTGLLSGTPTQPGPYQFSIVATPPIAGQVITFKGVIPEPSGTTTPKRNSLTDLGLNSLDPISPVVAVKPTSNQNLFVVSSAEVGTTTIAANKSLTGLVISSPEVQISVAGLTAEGQPLPLTTDKQLVVSTGLQFTTSGSGFLPNSELKIYIFSDPQLLATVKTDASGKWVAILPVPANLENGDHVLQINGYLKSSDVKSVSVGVEVVDQTSAQKISRVYEKVIPFTSRSTKVTTSSVALLNQLAIQAGSVVRILGYTKKSGSSKDIVISLDRAIEVKKALLKINPYLQVSVSGQGGKINKKCSSLKNLCAVVTVKR